MSLRSAPHARLLRSAVAEFPEDLTVGVAYLIVNRHRQCSRRREATKKLQLYQRKRTRRKEDKEKGEEKYRGEDECRNGISFWSKLLRPASISAAAPHAKVCLCFLPLRLHTLKIIPLNVLYPVFLSQLTSDTLSETDFLLSFQD